MAIDRIVLSLVIAIGGAAVLQGAAYAQDNQGTMEQQIACTPDVWRLCSSQIPDANRIVACLRQNTSQLSAPCRAVFESNNTVAQAPVPVPRGTVAQVPAPRGTVAQAPVQRGRRAPPPPRPDDDDDDQ
jgi:hypothetical protein